MRALTIALGTCIGVSLVLTVDMLQAVRAYQSDKFYE